MPSVEDLFDIEYGHSLSLNRLVQMPLGEGVPFVSRTARNNGVSAWVEAVQGVDPLPAGLLTVCLRSRNYTLATFLQPRPFYCGYHIFALKPKNLMTDTEKLWWATCIEANRYRYNFGRQANRSLATLQLPEGIPPWVSASSAEEVRSTAGGSNYPSPHLPNPAEWGVFQFDELFDLERGRGARKRDMRSGSTAFIAASAQNNGVSSWIDIPPDHEGGQITVCSNGSVGEAFYQPLPFRASGDVTVLVPKRELSPGAALFVCTIIRAEKYRWNYGRKWGIARLRESVLRLPRDGQGNPDWDAIDRYMQGLPLGRLVPEFLSS